MQQHAIRQDLQGFSRRHCASLATSASEAVLKSMLELIRGLSRRRAPQPADHQVICKCSDLGNWVRGVARNIADHHRGCRQQLGRHGSLLRDFLRSPILLGVIGRRHKT
eukprot:5741072-Amphidinium_carterae.1